MDIVVAYGGEEFLIEMKIWHGSKYRAAGIRQLEEYMESRKASEGYLISFSFNKKKENVCGWLDGQETAKRIFEAVI